MEVVPDPNNHEVLEFVPPVPSLREPRTMKMQRHGLAPSDRDQYDAIEGNWSSRCGMAETDPTIPGDAASKWKPGQAEVKAAGDRLYLLFNWDNGARRGLIDAHREGMRLVGKYINLTDPESHAPLDQLDREQSKDRWVLDRRTSGFPSIRRSGELNHVTVRYFRRRRLPCLRRFRSLSRVSADYDEQSSKRKANTNNETSIKTRAA